MQTPEGKRKRKPGENQLTTRTKICWVDQAQAVRDQAEAEAEAVDGAVDGDKPDEAAGEFEEAGKGPGTGQPTAAKKRRRKSKTALSPPADAVPDTGVTQAQEAGPEPEQGQEGSVALVQDTNGPRPDTAA